MSDRLTVLRSQGLALAKRWRADGSIEPYSHARNFHHAQHDVADLAALSTLLTTLENDPTACVVRGTPKAGVPQRIRRLLEVFDDHPHHWVLIEVDAFRPLLCDPLDGEAAALEYITEHLPSPFHGASFHWQLSNSAGAPGKRDILKVHLWFWLETPYDSYTLRAWAKAGSFPFDRAVLQPVQVHYTAAPVFDPGVADPVARRSGFHTGSHDAVPLAIDTSALDIRTQGPRRQDPTLDLDDPVAAWVAGNWETWGTLANGGMLISCPWEDNHSGGAKGDTSTAYFPAGTNGYPEGAFVCFHSHCDGRHKSDFLQAIGYTGAQFAAVAAPKTEVNGQHVNGAHVLDPLVLPPFKRKDGGKIETCLINVELALQSPKVCDLDLRYDVFKDAVVCSPRGEGRWRPFADVDYTELRKKMENVGLMQVGREMIRDGVHMVAQNQSFDTAIEWLSTLAWDGRPRMETFWIDHFGVEDTPYARAVGRYTWTAFAGRVMSPGVQADMAPILTGRQGMRKSRGVQALAPGPAMFAKMSFHEKDVDRARKMRGRLVVELDELQGLKSRESEEILSWVTRSEEDWTPKFMEMNTTYRRRFIMIATTNQGDFLDNPDGERRWLPLAVGRTEGFGKVDIGRLSAVRDQLWAEGREAFLREGIAYEEAEELAKAQHGQYKADDGWRQAVGRWLDTPDLGGVKPRDRTFLTLLDVAEGALSLPARAMKYGDQRRIAKIMSAEGYEAAVRQIGQKAARVWLPPDFC